MSNKNRGTAFERHFAQLLSQHGFWVHCIKDNENGQPFDVIAAKDGEALVFDCKDCQGNVFYLRRVEENQKSAMELWQECGNEEGMFAVRYPGELIYLFPVGELLEAWGNGIRYIPVTHARYYGARLEEWLERMDRR